MTANCERVLITQAVFSVAGFNNWTWQQINYSAFIAFPYEVRKPIIITKTHCLEWKIFNLTVSSKIQKEIGIEGTA